MYFDGKMIVAKACSVEFSLSSNLPSELSTDEATSQFVLLFSLFSVAISLDWLGNITVFSSWGSLSIAEVYLLITSGDDFYTLLKQRIETS